MKRILFFILFAVSLTAFAQVQIPQEYTIQKPLRLETVNAGSASDSVLVRGNDKIIKFVPRSEFAGGSGGSQDLNSVLGNGNISDKDFTLVNTDSDEEYTEIDTLIINSHRILLENMQAEVGQDTIHQALNISTSRITATYDNDELRLAPDGVEVYDDTEDGVNKGSFLYGDRIETSRYDSHGSSNSIQLITANGNDGSFYGLELALGIGIKNTFSILEGLKFAWTESGGNGSIALKGDLIANNEDHVLQLPAKDGTLAITDDIMAIGLDAVLGASDTAVDKELRLETGNNRIRLNSLELLVAREDNSSLTVGGDREYLTIDGNSASGGKTNSLVLSDRTAIGLAEFSFDPNLSAGSYTIATKSDLTLQKVFDNSIDDGSIYAEVVSPDDPDTIGDIYMDSDDGSVYIESSAKTDGTFSTGFLVARQGGVALAVSTNNESTGDTNILRVTLEPSTLSHAVDYIFRDRPQGEYSVATTADLILKVYTVSTLPVGTVGDTAYVTDATTPTYNEALTGGGSVVIPVFFNGTIWVSH